MSLRELAGGSGQKLKGRGREKDCSEKIWVVIRRR